jgi:protein AroM
LLTIGQSPRTDIVPGLEDILGPGIDIIEKGALDGMDYGEAASLGPEEGMTALVARMSDGAEVIVAKEKILPHITDKVNELNDLGVNLILLLCVGAFPSFESRCLILEPQRIVDHFLKAILSRDHHLGVLLPIPEQRDWARALFAPIVTRLTFAFASPYREREELTEAAAELTAAGCDLVVMYCMGFSIESARVVRRVFPQPVVLSNSLVARAAAELLA